MVALYVINRAKKIKAILMDVDGTMTDGSIYLTPTGDEIKRFNVKDGMGIDLARKAGLMLGILSGRASEAVRARASELGIKEVHQGVKDKGHFLDRIMEKYKLTEEEIAYIGDDLNDIPLMKRVGLAICVEGSPEEVRQVCVHKTYLRGGEGAVREAIEFILKAQERYEPLLAQKGQTPDPPIEIPSEERKEE